MVRASKTDRLIPLVILALSLLSPGGPRAADFPGGFVEKAYSSASRARVTSMAFLPAQRGPFTFPAPYNTQGVRITVPADCAGADCVQPVGYSYWAVMNNHVGGDTMYVVLNLRGYGGPTLFSYDKATDAVTKVGALFSGGSHAAASTELWYFSASQPTKLYAPLNADSKMYRYDVVARTFETVFDLDSDTALFGAGRYIWQAHSSADDSVHSFTVRSKADYAELGCGVYKEGTRQFLFFPARGGFDECQVDRSGRWLVIKENADGLDGEDNRIIDLANGTERLLLDRAGAGGHSDNGHGYMIAADNWASGNYSMKVWDFGASLLAGLEVYRAASWSTGGPNHVSHVNARAGFPVAQQFACGSGAWRSTEARGNELVCFRLDGSYDTLIVAPIMTDMNAAGGGDDYSKLPKASVDVTGQYALWTSNAGGNRMDAFIAKIPSQVLVGSSDPLPPPPSSAPVVSISAPIAGSTVSGWVDVAASSSADAGVAGVQFRLDGANLGAEVTSPPYAIAWNSGSSPNGAHTLNAVVRDTAGGSAVSALVDVTVANAAASFRVRDVVWTNLVNALATGNSLRKSAGCDGCADAGADSTQAIESGDGYIEFEASESASFRAIGLSRLNTDTSTGGIDFALWLRSGGYVEVRENNTYVTDIAFAPGDRFRIAVANGRVEYRKNGALFHTSARAPVYPLVADTALLTLGATIDKVVIGDSVAADTSVPSASITSPAVGATTTSCTVAVAANASDNVGVTAVQFRLDGADLGSALTVSPYTLSWNIAAVANGAHTLTAVARDAAGNTGASAPVTVTVDNTAAAPGPTVQDVVWVQPVRVAVTGSSLRKIAGCDGCADAGAASRQTLAGDGHVEFEASELNTSRAIGLTRADAVPAAQGGIASIDFALAFKKGYVEVRENGVYRTDSPYASGDKFRIAVVDNRVEYRRNGVLLHASAATPVHPLLVSASLVSLHATLKKVAISQPASDGAPTCSLARM